MQVRCCLPLLTAGTLYPAVTTISIPGLERRATAFSTGELGNVGKFRGSHVVPDNSADTMYICGLLLASDDKATWFEPEQEHGHLGEHSRR